MTKQLDKLLETHGSNFNERKRLAQAVIDNAFRVIFTEVEDLKFIRMIGYTPGFNDGDACTHSHLVAVDIYDTDEIFYDYWGVSQNKEDYKIMMDDDPNLALLTDTSSLDWSHSSWNSETGESIDNPLPGNSFHASIIKTSKILYALDSEFEITYGTNWQLDIVRADTDSGYTIAKSFHECGY